jgi:serine/threonine protein phosphatase 1
MTSEVAFVGDVHGSLLALRGILDLLSKRGSPHAVVLGDYINTGEHSAEVMGELIGYSGAGRATLLRGNHEFALLEALDSGDLKSFLRIGGAMTIRSYLGRNVRPDVLTDFRENLPSEHLQALRRMPETYEAPDVIARHLPPELTSSKFAVSAHSPVGLVPRIGRNSAQLDTGCGSESGRLTAMLWPSRIYLQVDMHGSAVVS